MRTHVGTGDLHDSLDRLLAMEARLESRYPDMPFDEKTEFSARLNSRGYPEEAWRAAVVFLRTTNWFRARTRNRLNQ